eukprot:551816-Pyramimonas_sp.AAC.1
MARAAFHKVLELIKASPWQGTGAQPARIMRLRGQDARALDAHSAAFERGAANDSDQKWAEKARMQGCRGA